MNWLLNDFSIEKFVIFFIIIFFLIFFIFVCWYIIFINNINIKQLLDFNDIVLIYLIGEKNNSLEYIFYLTEIDKYIKLLNDEQKSNIELDKLINLYNHEFKNISNQVEGIQKQIDNINNKIKDIGDEVNEKDVVNKLNNYKLSIGSIYISKFLLKNLYSSNYTLMIIYIYMTKFLIKNLYLNKYKLFITNIYISNFLLKKK